MEIMGIMGFLMAPNRLALTRNGWLKVGQKQGEFAAGERWVVIIINASFTSLAKWLFEQFVASLLIECGSLLRNGVLWG